MKPKKINLHFLIILIPIFLVFIFILFGQIKEETQAYGNITFSEGDVYKIMSNSNFPKFLEAVIDPQDVKVGDTQRMWIRVLDPVGIKSVLAEVEHDNGKDVHVLKLIEGDVKEGVYAGKWIVYDTHNRIYRTTFTATNIKGDSNSITLTWTDPCSPPLGGDWTLDGNCAISGVNGVDNGDFVLPGAGYTLTISAGATFAWNPGKNITINGGSIVISPTAQLKQTYLWVKDADGDNYASIAAGQAAQDTQPSDYIRRSTGGLVGITDCYDLNASARPGQTAWFATNRGDGSYDYNCDESNETQYTATHNVGCGGCSCCEGQSGSDQGGWQANTPPACGVSLTYISTSCTGRYGGCDCGSGPDFVHACSTLTQTCR